MAMKKKSRRKREAMSIAVVALVVCVVAACLGIGIFLHGKEKNKNEDMVLNLNGEQDVITYQGEKYQYNDHLSNYLFLGIDETEEVEEVSSQVDAGQADAIYLVSYDRVEKNLRILSIPRDTMTTVTSYNTSGEKTGTSVNHLNLQYRFGDGKWKSCELMTEAVSNLLYQTPIQGYCSLRMSGIPTLVELVGGVEVVVPDESLETVDSTFQKGETVLLTAENAERFVRYRDIKQTGSALVRQKRQEVFLDAYAKKARQSFDENPSVISDIYEEISSYMVTNMGTDLFVKLLEGSEQSVLEKEQIPGELVSTELYDEYRVDDDGLYELVLDYFYKKVK